MKQTQGGASTLRLSHLSRMLISQSSRIWEFHVSWCRFVTSANDHNSDRNHNHSLYEMQYVVRGSLSINIVGKPQTVLREGDWIILPPRLQHRLEFGEPDALKLVLGFSAKALSPRLAKAMEDQRLAQVQHETAVMACLMRALYEKQDELMALTSYIVSHLIQGLILEAINHPVDPIEDPSSPELKNSINDVRIDHANQYIRSKAAYAITAEEVAKYSGLNLRHLNRIYQRSTGHTVYWHIQQARVSYAQELLETTSMSLSDIAESMEFSSVYSFSRMFKNVCGVSPGKYQRDASER